VHVALGENALDLLESLGDSIGIIVGGRAVLAQQVLEHVSRNDSVLLELLGKVLPDNKPRKVLEDLMIQFTQSTLAGVQLLGII
jgi:hypothetical protein